LLKIGWSHKKGSRLTVEPEIGWSHKKGSWLVVEPAGPTREGAGWVLNRLISAKANSRLHGFRGSQLVRWSVFFRLHRLQRKLSNSIKIEGCEI